MTLSNDHDVIIYATLERCKQSKRHKGYAPEYTGCPQNIGTNLMLNNTHFM